MSEDKVNLNEQKSVKKEITSKAHSVDKNKTTGKEEQRKTKKKPTNDSHTRKKIPSRKRVIEKNETTASSSAIQLDLETTGVKEEQLVHRLDATMITIDGTRYEIVKNYKEAFDSERLGERYSEILDKYDYIVADWGFEQLRLKGFYDNRNRKVPQDQRINNLEDYLYEYCNFGCPYFVLHRLETKKSKTKGGFSEKSDKPARKRRNQKGKNPTNQKSERVKQPAASQSVTEKKKSKPTGTKGKRDFVKKEVTPATVQKETKVAEKEKAAFKTVQDSKGKRHFSIRRKDVETKKNNE